MLTGIKVTVGSMQHGTFGEYMVRDGIGVQMPEVNATVGADMNAKYLAVVRVTDKVPFWVVGIWVGYCDEPFYEVI